MKMPVLFVGHGSPMNAIEDNEFSQIWKEIGNKLPRPKAILAVSAHWYSEGTRTSDEVNPRMIYDMFGFPKELYEIKYPVIGSPELAIQIINALGNRVNLDDSWGIDHGIWSVLCHMYPDADIPVVQLSIDHQAPARDHYEIGKALSYLREEGVLILASGNVVHNLSLINWQMEGGYPWAYEFDRYIKNSILERNHDALIHYERAGESADKASYMPDHYYPLLYAIGASEDSDEIAVFNEKCVMGSMSMTGYRFG